MDLGGLALFLNDWPDGLVDAFSGVFGATIGVGLGFWALGVWGVWGALAPPLEPVTGPDGALVELLGVWALWAPNGIKLGFLEAWGALTTSLEDAARPDGISSSFLGVWALRALWAPDRVGFGFWELDVPALPTLTTRTLSLSKTFELEVATSGFRVAKPSEIVDTVTLGGVLPGAQGLGSPGPTFVELLGVSFLTVCLTMSKPCLSNFEYETPFWFERV